MALYIGIDLGATKSFLGLIDASGSMLHKIVVPTHSSQGAEAVVKRLNDAVQQLKSRASLPIAGVGIGVAGQVDRSTGVVFFAPNLEWHHFPLKERMQQLCGLPCTVVNDVRAATTGEWLFGAGRGCKDLLCLFIGTGIGGGAVVAGQLMIGHTNSAGEFGHITLDLNGPVCSCGNRGCFEALASGWAMARQAKERIEADHSAGKRILELVHGQLEAIVAKHVFEAYAEGDPLAIEIIEQVQEVLSAGIASLVNAFNPEKVILGGGVIENNRFLLHAIDAGVRAQALKMATSKLQIVKTQLGSEAGVIGAALGGFACKAS